MTAERTLWLALVAVLAVVASCGGSAPAASGAPGLRAVAELPLPGDNSRLDYQSVDAERHLLFIAHLGASSVIEVDTASGHVVRVIDRIRGVHGVVVVPALGRVFATATDVDELVTLDEQSGAVLARTPGGQTPDGLAYDPTNQRVFVSDEGGGETVVDANTGSRVASIDIGGEAGNTAYDPTANQILVDVQSRNELVVIDPVTNRVTRRMGLSGCDHDHGLYLDPATRRAFVACDGNNRLLVVNPDSGQALQRFGVGDGPDVLAFDPGLRRLYVAAESGVISVFDETQTGRVTTPGQAHLANNAHTVAVDTSTHRAYFPIPSLHNSPALLVLEPA